MSALLHLATHCSDCCEPITESERRAAIQCARCGVLMHAECTMATPTERDVCEPCFHADALAYRQRMKGVRE